MEPGSGTEWRSRVALLEAAGVTLTPPPPPPRIKRSGIQLSRRPPLRRRDTGIVRGRTLARTPPERRSQSEGLVRSGAVAAPRLQQEPSSIHPMGGIEGGNPPNRPFSGPLGAPKDAPPSRSGGPMDPRQSALFRATGGA